MKNKILRLALDTLGIIIAFIVLVFLIDFIGENILGITGYDVEFPSAVVRDNLVATQFHPEKSQTSGLRLLENFLNFKHE